MRFPVTKSLRAHLAGVRLAAGAGTYAWAALGLIVAAELLLLLVGPRVGLAAHLALATLLLLVRVLAHAEPVGRLALALALLPLVRIMSLGLPRSELPQLVWTLLVVLPLALAAWQVVRQLGLSREALGLRWGYLPVQLAFGAAGLPLGLAEHRVLRPAPVELAGDPALVVATVLTLLVAPALLEELVFRGLLQRLAWQALGLQGLLLAALLFGAMHIGFRSPNYVLFTCSVGYIFAYVAQRGGSLLGVSLAHGLASCAALLIAPALGSPELAPLAPLLPWLAAAGAVAASAAIARLALGGSPG